MVTNPRRFNNERQPLLPLNQVAKEINKRDEKRETPQPEQLDLLPSPQRDLFGDTEAIK